MLRRWVFTVTHRPHRQHEPGGPYISDVEETIEEIKIQDYTLRDAWVKVAAKLPLNTRLVEFTKIEYL
jgi:hypothetical protein